MLRPSKGYSRLLVRERVSGILSPRSFYVLQRDCTGKAIRRAISTTSPIPPPLPNETTSKSDGLNPQLHPTGRPPIKPSAPSSQPPLREPNVNQSSFIESASEEAISPTGGYRTPLRTTPSKPVAARDTVKLVYEGPLRKTVRGLKAFSISSLIFSASMTPFILTVEGSLPMVARVSMITAGTAH